MAKNRVVLVEKIFLFAHTIVSSTETIVSITQESLSEVKTMVSVKKKIFSAMKKMFSVPLTNRFAGRKLLYPRTLMSEQSSTIVKLVSFGNSSPLASEFILEIRRPACRARVKHSKIYAICALKAVSSIFEYQFSAVDGPRSGPLLSSKSMNNELYRYYPIPADCPPPTADCSCPFSRR
jgi:hypothetical protein